VRKPKASPWAWLAGPTYRATVELDHSEARVNSEDFPFPFDLFKFNSNQILNLVQILLNLVQILDMDEIGSKFQIQVEYLR
jgi:hypothetical protein